MLDKYYPALMAYLRDHESQSGKPVFRDAFAARFLKADRKEQIEKQYGDKLETMRASHSVRTRLFDDLILKAMAKGHFEKVICLGAGFDARPYRLPLPPTSVWYEVDFPWIVDEKNHLLQHEQAFCRVIRRAADLGNSAEVGKFVGEICRTHGSVLVIAEGLFRYLSRDKVCFLLDCFRRSQAPSWWIFDYVCAGAFRDLLAGTESTDEPKAFDPDLVWVESRGWKIESVIDLYEETLRRNPQGSLWEWFHLVMPETRRHYNATTPLFGLAQISRKPL
jgi:methyltransferase (TIGR00027 family)